MMMMMMMMMMMTTIATQTLHSSLAVQTWNGWE
jgi:hypothetical protein